MLFFRTICQVLIGNKNSPLILGLLIRLVIFGFICFFPIPFGVGAPISPFHYGGLDLWLYKELILLTSGNEAAIETFLSTYRNAFLGTTPEISNQIRYPGPVLPFFIWLTDYSPGNTFYLAITIFLLEAITYSFWQRFITESVGVPLSYFFSVLPQTLWFGLIISSDIFYYSFSSVVIILLLKGVRSSSAAIVIFTILAVLSRPVGIALPIFLLFFTLMQNWKFEIPIKDIMIIVLIIILAMAYYYPYLVTERLNLNDINPVKNYIKDHDISVNSKALQFFLEKTISLFFLFGVHPSDSQINWALIVRLISAVFFFVGLAHMFIKKDPLTIYALILIVPILFMFYPAWRYILPLIPVFLLHFLLAGNALLKRYTSIKSFN